LGILLFITVLLIAACGLIYELIAGTLASYLLGDSVLQFSTIIGCYLFAMGIGSALSRYIDRGLAYRFVWIELLLGVVGGCSSALLFLAFAYTQGFQLLMYALVVVIGILVGLEIPLLMRLVRGRYHFRDVVAAGVGVCPGEHESVPVDEERVLIRPLERGIEELLRARRVRRWKLGNRSSRTRSGERRRDWRCRRCRNHHWSGHCIRHGRRRCGGMRRGHRCDQRLHLRGLMAIPEPAGDLDAQGCRRTQGSRRRSRA